MQLTDLEWSTEFTSTILLHDAIVPNSYSVTIKFNSSTDNINNQNRAFDRMKYFFQSLMNNGLIMNYKNVNADTLSQYADKIIMIPEEPFDQIMVAIIHSKLINVVEGNIQITEVKLNSWQGDDVVYTSEAFGITKLFIEGDFGEVQWWQHTKPITFNPSDSDYKIPEWKDFNLEFDKKPEKPQNKTKKFNPTIIDGGKK